MSPSRHPNRDYGRELTRYQRDTLEDMIPVIEDLQERIIQADSFLAEYPTNSNINRAEALRAELERTWRTFVIKLWSYKYGWNTDRINLVEVSTIMNYIKNTDDTFADDFFFTN